MRKPRAIYNGWYRTKLWPNGFGLDVVAFQSDSRIPLYSNECRKLAAWLLKAADWLDEQESGKKKRGI